MMTFNDALERTVEDCGPTVDANKLLAGSACGKVNPDGSNDQRSNILVVEMTANKRVGADRGKCLSLLRREPLTRSRSSPFVAQLGH